MNLTTSPFQSPSPPPGPPLLPKLTLDGTLTYSNLHTTPQPSHTIHIYLHNIGSTATTPYTTTPHQSPQKPSSLFSGKVFSSFYVRLPVSPSPPSLHTLATPHSTTQTHQAPSTPVWNNGNSFVNAVAPFTPLPPHTSQHSTGITLHLLSSPYPPQSPQTLTHLFLSITQSHPYFPQQLLHQLLSLSRT